MKFQVAFTALSSAILAAAAPTTSSAFTLKVSSPESPINGMAVGASIGNLWLNLPAQNATCQHPVDEDIATFYLRDGELYLYATKAAPQMLYTDRSGMGKSPASNILSSPNPCRITSPSCDPYSNIQVGQGKLGYVTSGQGGPRNAEFDGWALDENNNLNMRGAEFIACPTSYIEGAWSLWVNAGNDNPGFNEGCVHVSANAVDEPKPISCHYTEM